MLVVSSFLPLDIPQTATGEVGALRVFLIKVLNLSPAVGSAIFLPLGTMILQPFVLSLIPTLGGHRLLGTYFGFYYLMQGIGVIGGNLAIGTAYDLSRTWGLVSLPWLLLLGLGLISAFRIMALDGCKKIDQMALLAAKKA